MGINGDGTKSTTPKISDSVFASAEIKEKNRENICGNQSL